ncbi:MAG: SPOR domain-containing protein [Magnetococcales bacterium]|nr:SPOR domain-containing protein [Magnetococcales bacterium]
MGEIFRKRLWWGLVWLVWTGNPLVAETAPDPLEAGRVALRAGQLEEAVEAFTRMLNTDAGREGTGERRLGALEGRCDALTRQALLQKRVEPALRAVEDCSAALREQANLGRVWRLRGLARLAAGQPEQALINFNHALRLDPADGVALRNRGVVLLGLGRLAEAEGDFQRAGRIDPDQAWHHFNRGVVHARNHRNNEAVDAWKEFLRLRGVKGREWLELVARQGGDPELKRLLDTLDRPEAAPAVSAPMPETPVPAPVAAPPAAPVVEPAPARSVPVQSGGFEFRLGSFQDRSNLDATLKALHGLGFPVREEEVTVGDRLFYRLVAGPFATEESARQAMERAARVPNVHPESVRSR